MQQLKALLLPALATSATAQFSAWAPDQINTTICTWNQVRAALIRDTVYLDGGDIYWSPGLDDGRLGTAVSDGNFQGRILSYNLSQPFGSDTNTTGILLSDRLSKARGGEGNSNGAAPDFYDGGLLYNDAEFFLYGGAQRRSQLYSDPDANAVLGYQAYQYGPEKDWWNPGFTDAKLSDDVTQYLAYGAAVSAPSENKAWYFSGLAAPSRGVIYSNPANESTFAHNVSNTLIEVNMETQLAEEWTNRTLPDDIDGRASAEAVWVPVGEQGILVILGGVIFPNWASMSLASSDPEESEDKSPEFMSVIDVYDIAKDEWYKQPTENGPSTRTRGCAVVARAADSSSFNIYYYGGYDGIHPRDAFYDDVWVLSLPSFTWIQLNKGTSIHGRAAHKCFSPAPDQMLAFGGFTPLGGSVIDCLYQGPIINFNLTSGEWLDSYHPDEHSDYGVPDKVHDVIGGSAKGGATLTAPDGGWATDALGDVFSKEYDMDKIKTWGPFPAATTEAGRSDLPDDGDDNNDSGGGGLPGWVAPVLGVVLGLIFLTTLIVLFCLYRRRKIFKNRSSDSDSQDNGPWILSWLKGQSAYNGTEKEGTVTTAEETQNRDPVRSPNMTEVRAHHGDSYMGHRSQASEMAGTPIAELDDTSPPAELYDTGLSPIDIIQKHSLMGSRNHSNPSYSSLSGAGGDFNSTVSRSSAPQSNAGDARPDHQIRIPSGLSGISGDYIRSLSERIDEGTSSETRPVAERRISEPPVSPPTAGGMPSEAYLNSRAMLVSPLRKSIFHEDEDDLGKAGKDKEQS